MANENTTEFPSDTTVAPTASPTLTPSTFSPITQARGTSHPISQHPTTSPTLSAAPAQVCTVHWGTETTEYGSRSPATDGGTSSAECPAGYIATQCECDIQRCDGAYFSSNTSCSAMNAVWYSMQPGVRAKATCTLVDNAEACHVSDVVIQGTVVEAVCPADTILTELECDSWANTHQLVYIAPLALRHAVAVLDAAIPRARCYVLCSNSSESCFSGCSCNELCAFSSPPYTSNSAPSACGCASGCACGYAPSACVCASGCARSACVPASGCAPSGCGCASEVP
ncbi:hypothetical protein CYMTET_13787 [Cymbomonas tetramitiformis]|uniref:Uncharacterized protein n=1 Tax=Cymbomonas tetramitiformis TaxID=36881 RepID=A0AAE0GHN6_9CHLO|nr:hypothetical protein CYMTET_13787 [Cymbomonas tetramitiformis]